MAAIKLSKTHKVGSTWTFAMTRKDSGGTAIDLTGLTVRAMFRETDANGAVIATLSDASGIVVEPLLGRVTMTLTPTQTALFTPNAKAVFDVEMSRTGYAWQSPTYSFKTEPEVTRDA